MDTLAKNHETTLTTKWTNDPTHSELQFKVKHMMINNVKGVFKKFDATILSNGDDFSHAKATVSIDAASIFTNTDQRDNHLRSADFFDVENHEKITFESTEVKKQGEENYILKGMLTIKNISKEVTLNVEYGGLIKDPYGLERVGFSLSGKISRKEWELKYNPVLETGGFVVGDEVSIYGDLEFIKQAEK